MGTFDASKYQALQKENLEMLTKMTEMIFDNVEQLSTIQLKALRHTTEETIKTYQKALSIRDPQSFADFQSSLTQVPVKDNALMQAGREFSELCTKNQAELAKLTEAQLKKYSQNMNGFVDSVSLNAPTGSEPVVAAWKAAIDTANTLYDNVQKTVKQATSFVEEGISAATNVAEKAAKSAKK